MTARRSTESSRADNAVEPTRSQNITVRCRRSASEERLAVGASLDGCSTTGNGGASPRSAAMASRSFRRSRDADAFEILAGQLRKYLGVYTVVAKRRFVLLQPQAPQPHRNVHAALPVVEPFSLVGFKLARSAARSVLFHRSLQRPAATAMAWGLWLILRRTALSPPAPPQRLNLRRPIEPVRPRLTRPPA